MKVPQWMILSNFSINIKMQLNWIVAPCSFPEKEKKNYRRETRTPMNGGEHRRILFMSRSVSRKRGPERERPVTATWQPGRDNEQGRKKGPLGCDHH